MTTQRQHPARKAASPGTEQSATDDEDVNLVVIVGHAARDATVTESGDGTIFTSFDAVCRIDGTRAVVPVTLEGECAVTAGARIAVLGRVNKRFFASGAGLASRTDVRADKVTVVKRRDQVSRVIAAAVGSLGGG